MGTGESVRQKQARQATQPKQKKPKKTLRLVKVAATGVTIGLVLSLSFTAYSIMKSKTALPRVEHIPVENVTPETYPKTQTSPEERKELDAEAARIVATMTTEEKVAQLFFATPEALTDTGHVVSAGEETKNAYEKIPVGGIIYFEKNLIDSDQARTMLETTQKYCTERMGIPVFLAVDEEGGTVARVGGNDGFGVENPGDMRLVGDKLWGLRTALGAPDVRNMSPVIDASRDKRAWKTAHTIGTYLTDLGFNVDFAPDADIANTDSKTMQRRSFGTTSEEVSPLVAAQVEGFRQAGILSAAKHFPGIGGAEGDSHTGAISSPKTIEEMKAEELQPFQSAIDADVAFIMVGHLTVEEATGSQLPASLNPAIMTELLREDMGYDGLIITDSLGMGAVTRFYDVDEVGLQAILAGADMILMPKNLDKSYNIVLAAARDGRLSEERLNESVQRIVRTKLEMGQ